MKKLFLLALLLTAVGTFWACAGVQVTYVPLKEGVFPPVRPAKDIPVLTGTLSDPYEELGIILIRKYPGSLEEEISDKFREVARLRGADAVIHVRAAKHPFFSISPFFFSFPLQGIEARGVAVRFREGTRTK